MTSWMNQLLDVDSPAGIVFPKSSKLRSTMHFYSNLLCFKFWKNISARIRVTSNWLSCFERFDRALMQSIDLKSVVGHLSNRAGTTIGFDIPTDGWTCRFESLHKSTISQYCCVQDSFLYILSVCGKCHASEVCSHRRTHGFKAELFMVVVE